MPLTLTEYLVGLSSNPKQVEELVRSDNPAALIPADLSPSDREILLSRNPMMIFAAVLAEQGNGTPPEFAFYGWFTPWFTATPPGSSSST